MSVLDKIYSLLSSQNKTHLLQFANTLYSRQSNDVRINVFLALQRIKGFGSKSLAKMYSFSKELHLDWSDVDCVHETLSRSLAGNNRLKPPTLESLRMSMAEVFSLREQYVQYGIDIVPIWSELYPSRFKNVEGAPVLLFCKGNVSALNAQQSVAIVGTREPSQVGLQAGYRYGEIFAQNNFVVVSGLAKGCDTVGHKGCLDAEGITVAVLAHSLDLSIYPKVNISLAERILQNKGLLVSEYPLGTNVSKASFIQRDKWQAALVDGLVVVETGLKGGTMHTVQFAQELKRNIGCFYLEHEKWKIKDSVAGNVKLLTEGAARLSSKGEIENFMREIT